MSRLGLNKFIQAGGKSTCEQGFKSVAARRNASKFGGMNLLAPFWIKQGKLAVKIYASVLLG
jgi:hypothetical protein